MKKCLIVSSEDDIHSDKIEKNLSGKNISTLRLTYLSSEIEKNRFYLDLNSGWISDKNGNKFYFSEIDIVIWRFKVSFIERPFNDSFDEDLLFRQREYLKFIRSLKFVITNAIWLNDPISHEFGGLKINQLITAKNVGFIVPDTIISNDDKSIFPFIENGNSIYKTLSHPFFNNENVIFSTVVDKKNLSSSEYNFALSPNFFQKYIEKKFEVRVVYCLNNIHSTLIKSQDNIETSVDWRIDQYNKDMYENHKLPKDVEEKIRFLMFKLGLNYGTIDLIISETEEYTFLEVNPGGQWLWIESLLGCDITEFICNSIENNL